MYKKSNLMPHMEGDAEEDLSSSTSRHLGKLETEAYLKAIGVPFTCFRPTYIYGTYNYIPLEEYFFARLEAGRTVFIPGHGQHIKGLGHVQDLACAMAQAVGRDVTKGKIYNIQGKQSVTFESLATLCCEAMNKDPQRALRIGYYDKSKFDFGGEYYDKSKFDFDRKVKMSFPLANAEQHRFCSIDAAISDLEWYPEVDMLSGLKDSYENDFKAKLAAGWFSGDDYFGTDDLIATQLQKKQESIRGRYCLAA